MVSRSFWFQLFFIVSALILQVLVSISVPMIQNLEIIRTELPTNTSVNGVAGVTEVHFGIWAPCYSTLTDIKCQNATAHGYSINITREGSPSVVIGLSWIRGLAFHVVAALAIAAALVLEVLTSPIDLMTCTSGLVSSIAILAAVLTLGAFVIDIALLFFVKGATAKLHLLGITTSPGLGFWLTLGSFISVLLGGYFIWCIGRGRDIKNSMKNQT